ncbi:hypothetical protein RB601_001077 [Gaeumannomyces tritici]
MEAAQEALSPFIRPRDEVLHIRKILSANLASCLGNAAHDGPPTPLALADPLAVIVIPPEARGIQREYLEALNANIRARGEHQDLVARHRVPATTPAEQTTDFLTAHIVALKLRNKEARLRAISKSLELLDQRPAASTEFLDPNQIFKDSPRLPEMPREAVSSFVLDKTLSKAGLDELLDRLQKSVLRAKLLLKKEEQLLGAARKRSPRPVEGLAPVVKLAALTAARNELISWIETELASTSGDGAGGGEEQHTNGDQVSETRARVENQLSAIKQKYDNYVATRKQLLRAASQTHQPLMEPPSIEPIHNSRLPGQAPAMPASYLLSPYLARLLTASHEQKGLILQKSHLNATIAKKTKDTCQLLDHLAEESQLLPKHHIPGRPHHQPRLLGDGPGSAEGSTVAGHSRRWVVAAEASKLATLETVAEKTEEGEMALEISSRHLDEISHLLGAQTLSQDRNPDTSEGDGDIWLSQGRSGEGPLNYNSKAKPTDIWSILDGGLGVLRAEGGDDTFY